MISDVMSEAVGEIDRYLSDEVMGKSYQGAHRAAILVIRDQMNAIRMINDIGPFGSATTPEVEANLEKVCSKSEYKAWRALKKKCVVEDRAALKAWQKEKKTKAA